MAGRARSATGSGRWLIPATWWVLDEAAFAALAGVEVWIVDALRYTPHPTHAHLARTLELDRARCSRAAPS